MLEFNGSELAAMRVYGGQLLQLLHETLEFFLSLFY
jgi:hypothetical protein